MNHSRSKQFRKSVRNDFDSLELRDRRVKVNLQFRKKRREDEATKRRMDPINSLDDLLIDVEMLDISNDKKTLISNEHFMSLFNENVFEQMSGLDKLSRLQWRHSKDVVNEMAKLGLVPRIIQMLQSVSNCVQSRAGLVLSEISTHLIADILPPNSSQLLSEALTKTTDGKVKAQILFIITNIAVESSTLRDQILYSDFPSTLSKVLQNSNDYDVERNGVTALTTLCMGLEPPPNSEKIGEFIPILVHLLDRYDSEIITNTCFALSYLCDSSKDHIQRIVEANACPRLVQLLENPNTDIIIAVLYVLGKITSGNDLQTQAVIDSKAIPVLHRLMKSKNKKILLDACWVISNIVVGERHQLQAVIDANVFPDVLLLLKSSQSEIVSEAAWIIRHASNIRRTSLEQFDYLDSIGCVDFLCSMLTTTHSQTLSQVLHAIDSFVVIGFNLEFHEVRAIDRLTSSEDPKVSKYAQRIQKHLSEVANERGM